jgi:hypothetical protein
MNAVRRLFRLRYKAIIENTQVDPEIEQTLIQTALDAAKHGQTTSDETSTRDITSTSRDIQNSVDAQVREGIHINIDD